MCIGGISQPMAASLSRTTEVEIPVTDKKNSLSENSSQLIISTKSASNTNESRQKSETVRETRHNAYQSYQSMLKEAGKKIAENKGLTGNYSASRTDVARHKLPTSAATRKSVAFNASKNQTNPQSLPKSAAKDDRIPLPNVKTLAAMFEGKGS